MSAYPSLDHLVRAQQDRLRDRETKGLRGLKVDHQVELRGLLDRQIGGLRSFEDLVHIGRRTTKQRDIARRIRQQSPSVNILPVWVHRWQPQFRYEINDPCSVRQ